MWTPRNNGYYFEAPMVSAMEVSVISEKEYQKKEYHASSVFPYYKNSHWDFNQY